MDEIKHESFTITRTFAKCRAHVWSAWSDRDKKWRWLTGATETSPDYVMDFRVGGSERSAFTSPMGKHENHTTYFDIRDEEHIVYAYSMSVNGRVHSVSVATVTFADDGGGTRMTYAEQITMIGPSDGAEGRQHGWNALFDKVEPLLEAEMA
jgi:uncharacterized protein YndB with AHSA1/START domain